MRMNVRILVVALTVLALNAPGRAHHSVPVNFDASREVTIEGVLTEIRWLNPHSRFRIEVKNEEGTAEEWLVEMGAINTMRRAGFDTDRFAVGDTITIIGRPGWRGRAMLLQTAVLADGTRLSP
jgi:hypothetical protein